MSDSKAYTYYVNPNGSGSEENNQVHQVSPSWVLTFIRWKYRDTYRIDDAINAHPNQNLNALGVLKDTLDPLVVTSDCINLTVACNKASLTPYMEATLLQTDVNYLTAIAPGDFVLINMVNWQSQADNVYDKVHSKKGSINGFDDGFKGIFKIQSVRRITSVIDPATGKRGSVFKITGFAFTEFNNMLYFDPSVALQSKDIPIFAAQINTKWQQLVSANKNQSIQDLIKVLISSFIGSGSPRTAGSSPTGTQFQSPNDAYFMPGVVGKLLGVPEATVAADIYNYLFGLQKYENTGVSVTHADGLNPLISKGPGSSEGFFYTTLPVAGRAILAPEYWNQVPAWSILNQYTNAPLNEFFSCFRVDPVRGVIMPTIVLRQIPFTNEDFYVNNGVTDAQIPVTMFLSLPRWKIHPTMVISQDIGRDEVLRINYVQVFARLLNGPLGSDYTMESANHNYRFDINDIQRSGLKPKVTSSMFDLFNVPSAQKSFNSPDWAKIHADALIGGHLKMNGTFVCAGIMDPIAVGDNLEFEDIVYHIEQVSHQGSFNPANGINSFRTTIKVSQGVSIYSNAANGTSYPEMENPNAYSEREWDYARSQILPGVSESQDTPGRRPNVDGTGPLDSPDVPLPQPKQTGVFPDNQNTKNGQ